MDTTEIPFAQRPLDPFIGQLVNFSDAWANTWGTIVRAGGSSHVLARWNGTAWTVVGK